MAVQTGTQSYHAKIGFLDTKVFSNLSNAVWDITWMSDTHGLVALMLVAFLKIKNLVVLT